MKEFPALKMTKVEDAEHCISDSDSYRIPAVWQITGPTGNVYTVRGTAYGRMQYPRWSYSREQPDASGNHPHRVGFNNRYAVLQHINRLEQATR